MAKLSKDEPTVSLAFLFRLVLQEAHSKAYKGPYRFCFVTRKGGELMWGF